MNRRLRGCRAGTGPWGSGTKNGQGLTDGRERPLLVAGRIQQRVRRNYVEEDGGARGEKEMSQELLLASLFLCSPVVFIILFNMPHGTIQGS